MVGIGTLLALLGLAFLAVRWRRKRLPESRWFYGALVLAGPLSVVALICGWVTTEVGRQPWVVYGLLRTKDAVTPSLTTGDVLFSLSGYVLVYAVFIAFGTYYTYKLLRIGPTGPATPIPGATPNRPMAFADDAASATGISATGKA